MGARLGDAYDVRLIPMVNRWYATSLLVSPMTFGLMTKFNHLPLLESFIEEPEVHRQSVRTPSLRGGPFIDYDGNVADVERFIEETRDRCLSALQLADEISRLYSLLGESAGGAGMQALYSQMPSRLQGQTELVYDAAKQASPRFHEAMFYRNDADTSLQSCLIAPISRDERPFILSTPLLALPEGAVELHAAFSHDIWDLLFDAHRNASVDDVLQMAQGLLRRPQQDLPRLECLLRQTRRARPAVPRYAGEGVRIRYFGHACVLIESRSVSVLVDPLISYQGEAELERFTFDDLPDRIDYVLITHSHADHLVLETLLQIRHRVGCVVVGRASGGNLQDASPRLALLHCGFSNVVELDELDFLAVDGGKIVAAPFYGEHGDLDIRAKAAFGVELQGSSCVFLADSNPPHPECYRHLKETLPPVDCLFVGMECVGAPATWAYGALLQRTLTRGEDQSRRLNGSDCSTAMGLRDFFVPDRLFVYAMGAEPWVTHISSIAYSEDLPQFKEARKLEHQVRAAGQHTEVIYAHMELHLPQR